MSAETRQELLACTALVFATLFWAGNAVTARGLVGEVPPMALSFWRWALAFLLLAPFALPHLRQALPTICTYWRRFALLAFLSAGAFNTLLYLAAQTTTAVNINLVTAAMPVFVGVFAFAIGRERLRQRQVLGIFITVPGTLLVISQGSLDVLLAIAFRPGDLWMLLAVSCWALYSVLLRRLHPNLHPLALLLVIITMALPMVLSAYLLELALGYHFTPSLQTLPPLLYVAIFPSILSYLGWNYGVSVLGPARSSMFMYLLPVFGAVLAMLFLGERLEVYHAMGAVLILWGLYLATRPVAVAGSSQPAREA